MNILAEGLHVANSVFVHINYTSANEDPTTKIFGVPPEIFIIILSIIGIGALATTAYIIWRIKRDRKKRFEKDFYK
jgi:hypothetical protein